jgi:hypothetical protein
MTKNRGRPRTPPHIRRRILELRFLEDRDMRDIEHVLQRELGPNAVSYNTIRAIVKAGAPPEDSGLWGPRPPIGFATGHPDRVVSVVGHALAVTEGRAPLPSARLADWIAAVREWAPGLDSWQVFIVANHYRWRELDRAPMDDLDAYLLYAPWRAPRPEAFRLYARACRDGKVRPAPWFNPASRVESESLPEDLKPGVSDYLTGQWWSWKLLEGDGNESQR